MTNTTTNPSTTAPAATESSSGSAATARPVTWFEVHTTDPDRARAFYAAAFGWRYDTSMPEYTVVDGSAGEGVSGGIVDTRGQYPTGVTFNIQVPNVADALRAVVAAGGSEVMGVQQTPIGLTFAYGADPDGSVFGLWCPPAG